MKVKKIPMRKCVGCNTSKPKGELLRIAFYEGQISIDETGRAKGRGVYLCKDDKTCIENAAKRKAIQRAFQEATKEQIDELFTMLQKEQDEKQ